MTPDQEPRKFGPVAKDTILVRFTSVALPPDSPEFQERARRAAERPIPPYLREKPEPDDNPPAAT